MSLSLPRPSPAYDANDQAQTRLLITQADMRNVKTTSVLNSFKMKDTVTGVTHTITLTSGSLVVT